MLDELIAINKCPELTDRDVKILLKVEEILVTRKPELFDKYMDMIKEMCLKVDDNWKTVIAKYIAMLAFKNQQELVDILKRTPQAIAQKTGLKNIYLRQYISPRNRETIVQLVRADALTAISDTRLIRDFYRGIVTDDSQPLFFRVKCAQLLESSHNQPRAKPNQFFRVEGDLTAQGDIYKQIVNNPDNIPAFNNPDVRERIAAGERLRLNGGTPSPGVIDNEEDSHG